MVVSRQSDSIGDASVLATTGQSRENWRTMLTDAGATEDGMPAAKEFLRGALPPALR